MLLQCKQLFIVRHKLWIRRVYVNINMVAWASIRRSKKRLNVDAKSQLQVRTLSSKNWSRRSLPREYLFGQPGKWNFFVFNHFFRVRDGKTRSLLFSHLNIHTRGAINEPDHWLFKTKCQPQIIPATWGDEIESNACKVKPARHSSNYAKTEFLL